ncbi:hypothetical protein AB5I41_01020 [Sphingomonas sp. MMS24-JH45]
MTSAIIAEDGRRSPARGNGRRPRSRRASAVTNSSSPRAAWPARMSSNSPDG